MKVYDERNFTKTAEKATTVEKYCKEHEKDERKYYILDTEYIDIENLFEGATPLFKPNQWDIRQEKEKIIRVWMNEEKVILVI